MVGLVCRYNSHGTYDKGVFMRIIIEVKDTATLSRIEAFSKLLEGFAALKSNPIMGFGDVIRSISKEW